MVFHTRAYRGTTKIRTFSALQLMSRKVMLQTLSFHSHWTPLPKIIFQNSSLQSYTISPREILFQTFIFQDYSFLPPSNVVSDLDFAVLSLHFSSQCYITLRCSVLFLAAPLQCCTRTRFFCTIFPCLLQIL